MSDRETLRFELTGAQSREVIAALADARTGASGERDRRLRNLQDRLEVEFGFDEHRTDDGDGGGLLTGTEGWFDDDAVFDRDQREAVELSRTEADDVLAALADYEPESAENDRAAADVRARIAEAF